MSHVSNCFDKLRMSPFCYEINNEMCVKAPTQSIEKKNHRGHEVIMHAQSKEFRKIWLVEGSVWVWEMISACRPVCLFCTLDFCVYFSPLIFRI